jgi:hypothetical protein
VRHLRFVPRRRFGLGYGRATSEFFVTGFWGFDDASGCGDVTAAGVIALASGAARSRWTRRARSAPRPRGSDDAAAAEATTPGSAHSFGNPYRLNFSYTVAEDTGVFAGAQGSGSVAGGRRVGPRGGAWVADAALKLPAAPRAQRKALLRAGSHSLEGRNTGSGRCGFRARRRGPSRLRERQAPPQLSSARARRRR